MSERINEWISQSINRSTDGWIDWLMDGLDGWMDESKYVAFGANHLTFENFV